MGCMITPVTQPQELNLISRVRKERLESSGTVAKTHSQEHSRQELDLTLRLGKEDAPVVAPLSEADSTRITDHAPVMAPLSEADSTRITEHAQAQTVPKLFTADEWKSWTEHDPLEAHELMLTLVEKYGSNDNGLASLASELLEAKVNGIIDSTKATALEKAMLQVWKGGKDKSISFEKACGLLGLFNEEPRGQRLLNEMLEVLRLFIEIGGPNGGRSDIYCSLNRVLYLKRYKQIIVELGEESATAYGMLWYLVERWIQTGTTPKVMFAHMHGAHISEPTAQRLLFAMRNYQREEGTELFNTNKDVAVKAFQVALTEGWEKTIKQAAETTNLRSDQGASSSMRKKYAALRHEPAPAPKKRTSEGRNTTGPSKRQKTTGPSVRR
uniref:RxLR effector candidate protein n=1 Tax=Hyaloperonospora arabidopsidis (strain Emoy2) TaxID=559515 RepID=M4C5A5_HYAAE